MVNRCLNNKSEHELEEDLLPRKRSGLFGNIGSKKNNADDTKKAKGSDKMPVKKNTSRVKAKEPVHVIHANETPTPPLSPDSSESTPVSNIVVKHHNSFHNNSKEEHNDDGGVEMDEQSMFSDITGNLYSSSNNNSPASTPSRDKSKNNNTNGQPKTKLAVTADSADVAAGTGLGGNAVSGTTPGTDAPGTLNTAEAMKERMRNHRQAEASPCCGSEDTTAEETTFVSKMFSCNVPVGAYKLDGTPEKKEGDDNSLQVKERINNFNKSNNSQQKKKTYAQQQQQQYEQDHPQDASLRKVLSFTPVWGVAPSMDDDDDRPPLSRFRQQKDPPTSQGEGTEYSYSNTHHNSNTNPYSNTHSISTHPYHTPSTQSIMDASTDTDNSADSPKSTSSVPDSGIEMELEDFHVDDLKISRKENVKRGWRRLFEKVVQKHKGESDSSSSEKKTSTTTPAKTPSPPRAVTPFKSRNSKSNAKTTPPSPSFVNTKKERKSSSRNVPPRKIRYERMPEEGEEKRLDEAEEYQAKQRRITASLQEELEAARATTSHKKRQGKKAKQEARYKYLLSSFKGSPKRTSLLETVMEGDGDQERSLSNEYTEMKVRVPGMDQPDAFLTDDDLVGAEFIEEDSGDEEDDDDYESDDEDEIEEQPAPADMVHEIEEQPAPAAMVPTDEPVIASVAVAVPVAISDEETKVEEAVPEPAVVVEEDAKEITPVEEKQKLWLAQIIKVDTQKLWLESIRKIVKVPNETVVPPPTPKRVHMEEVSENPNPLTKSNSVPWRDKESPLQRTRSWYARLGLKKAASLVTEQDIKSDDSVSLARNRSAPMMKNSPKANKKKSKGKTKPLWKATVDESSGLTYYYHRLTRQTTWTKPDDFGELLPPSPDEEDEIEKIVHSGESVLAAKRREIMESLRKQTSRDFDPEVWKTKNDIVNILTTMTPPDGNSVERLMKTYEGNEETLLTNLRDLSDSRPFDEPIRNVSTGSPNDVSNFEDSSPARISFDDKRTRSGATSLLSGYSGITKVSEQTDLIRNTADTTRPTLDASSSTDGSNSDDHSVGEAITPTRVPSNIPVLRIRELQVEEFTTSEGRVKAETFTGSGYVRSPRKNQFPEDEEDAEPSFFSVFDLSPYLGDNDDTTDVDTITDTITDTASVPTSAISGLSEAHSTSDEFANHKKDGARRRALDEAIASEDWDLAADLSEGLRANTKSKPSLRRVPKEWTQSELDKFISENDWDAVANYIAHVRDSAKTTKASSQRNDTTSPTSAQRKLIGPANPKKRFGALSQLQHEGINSDSSWDSSVASSYFSEDSSSNSSYTDEDDPLYTAANAKRRTVNKEFAC